MTTLDTTHDVLAPTSSAVTAPNQAWDNARKWLHAAERLEQAKLYSQVMLGFELMHLRKTHGIKPGNPNFPNVGKLERGAGQDDWESILKRETGLAQSTAYRFMDMAKAAAPRLKKLKVLRDFDPSQKPLAELPAPQQKALGKAVRKLTDGLTQRSFGEHFGLWKKPQGSGAVGHGGAVGPARKLTLGEQAELLRLQASEDWKGLEAGLEIYRAKFCALSDADVTAQAAVLERALKARTAWLKQPLNQRDSAAIDDLLK